MPKILFEDDQLLVVSKPPGQTVNRAETTANEITLQDELEKYLGVEKSEEGIGSRAGIGRPDSVEPSNFGHGIGGRAGIVHRLDKETSGILVVAKTLSAFEHLQAQFKAREVDKTYLTLVHGETLREGKIQAPIARHPKFRVRFEVVEGGREASTEYQRAAVYKKGEESYSFVEVHPQTGRTHQIRVHFKHLGFPVVSDPLYLSPKRLKQDLLFCPRLFLHAASLSFTHPATGARMRFEDELPADLQKVLSILAPVRE